MSPRPEWRETHEVKQLSGLDASFLYMETPTTYGHVNGLAIYERPSPDFDPFQAAYDRFDALIGRLEPMRRRLVEVPFRLDHPYWIDDPDFDLDFHVRHIGLAPPGGADQLAEQVARIVGSTDGPVAAAVGGLRHRGPRRRSLGDAHQDPPRHHRRRVRACCCSAS